MPEDKKYKTILYEKKDYIAHITINRPSRKNSLTIEVESELADAFQRADEEADVGLAVISGAEGKDFCAGAEVQMFLEIVKDPNQTRKMLTEFQRMHHNARTMGKPVVAKVRGWSIGGAIELLTACDIVIASEDAKFWPGEARLGGVPYLGSTQLLTLYIGDRRARWLNFTDDVIDAKTALDWGFVNKVVPPDKLDEEVDKVCQTLLNKSPWALRYAKTQLNVWGDLVSHTFPQGRDFWVLESILPDLQMFANGFLEKKPVNWLELREKMAKGKPIEYPWGPATNKCPKCGAKYLPAEHQYCGACGAKL